MMKLLKLLNRLTFCFILIMAVFIPKVNANPFFNGEISGTVKDSVSKEALAYASVSIAGTVVGTLTDLDGNFRIPGIKEGNYVLKISYIGYQSKEMPFTIDGNGQPKIEILLCPASISLKDIVISSQQMGQNAAINQQLNSNAIVNVISKDRIREIPDVNAAEAIGRLPGVSLVRMQGEGARIVLRGLEPKFSTVSINGVKQASTDGSDRSVDLSGISPELLSGVEVYKSPTADMDGDAIGGNINLVINKAPDIKRNQFRVYGGYSDLHNKADNYKGSWDYSSRFLANKLGIMVQATYEKMDRSAQGIEMAYYNPNAQIADTFFINNITLTNRKQETKRFGGNVFVDYQFNWGNIYLTNMYNSSPRKSFIQTKQITRDGQITTQFTSNESVTNVFNTTLGGLINLKNAKLNWSANRVQSNVYNPYEMGLVFWLPAPDGLVKGAAGLNAIEPQVFLRNINFNSFRSKVPYFNSVDTLSYLRSAAWSPDSLKQTNYSAKVDLEIPIKISDEIAGFIKLGGKYSSERRKKTIVNYVDQQYYLKPALSDTAIKNEPGGYLRLTKGRLISMQNFLTADIPSEFMGGQYEFWPYGNESKIRGWHDNHMKELVSDPSTIENSYETTENLSAAYIMLKLNYKDIITFIPGVRYEYSSGEYHGYYSTIAGAMGLTGYYQPDTSFQKYGEVLPSMHLKIKPIEWFDLRISIAKTIARPNYSWIIPRLHYNSGNYTVSKGNPELKHATSWNYDASATIFSNKIGLISLGGYYKKINNMFYQTKGTLTGEQAEKVGLPSQPFDLDEDYINLDNSWVKGIEFEVNTHFNFLPEPFNRFALGFNATRLWSNTYYLVWKKVEALVLYNNVRPVLSVDFDKSYYQQTPSRMPSQVDYTCNAWVGYDYKGFTARISMSYQGTRLLGVNTESLLPGYNNYADSYLRFDASIKQKVNKYVSVLLNLNNISNAPEEGYRYMSDYPTYTNVYGFTFDLGVQVAL